MSSAKGPCTLITRVDENKDVRLDHAAFLDFVEAIEIGDEPFCVVSISGKARQGKSFMMNLILRYLKKSGWKDDWIGSEKDYCDMSTFYCTGGPRAITAGIHLYHGSLEVPWNTTKMKVILMDTQGLFDEANSNRNDRFLLTLTTLMSSVQIFNMKQNIDTNELSYLKTAIDYAEKSKNNADGESGKQHLKLQDLVLLLRDIDDSEEYAALLESKEGWHLENLKLWDRIKSSFKRVQLHTLPVPPKSVRTGKYREQEHKNEIKFKVIGDEFLDDVKEFLLDSINPQKGLQPKIRNNGQPCRAKEVIKMMACCDSLFANSDGRNEDELLSEANERVIYDEMFAEAIKNFLHEIDTIQTVDIDEVKRLCNAAADKAKSKYQEDASKRLPLPGVKDFRAMYEDRLNEEIDEGTDRKLKQMDNEKRQQDLERQEQTRNAFNEYCRKMKDMANVLNLNLEVMREEHHKILTTIETKERKNIDVQNLRALAEDEFEKTCLWTEEIKAKAKAMVERERTILTMTSTQASGLDGIWKKELSKYMQTHGMTKIQETGFSWLGLDEDMMRQVASEVERKVQKRYWDLNLTLSEKSANLVLKKKLYEHLETRFGSADIDSKYGKAITPKLSMYEKQKVEVMNNTKQFEVKINELERGLQDYLQGIAIENREYGPEDAIGKAIESHMAFFEFCSPGLKPCYNELIEKLKKKNEDILQEQKRQIDSRKELFLLRINENINDTENVLCQEMTDKNLKESEITNIYEEAKQEMLSYKSISSILGFNPSSCVFDWLKEEAGNRYSASQKEILDRNKKPKIIDSAHISPEAKKAWYQRMIHSCREFFRKLVDRFRR